MSTLHHTQAAGFKLSNAVKNNIGPHGRGREIHWPHYTRDGAGRDDYIALNNGGFNPKYFSPPKGTVYGQQMYVGKGQNGPRQDIYPQFQGKTTNYTFNGSGRDGYIALSNGGFYPQKTVAEYANNFQDQLRVSHFKQREATVDYMMRRKHRMTNVMRNTINLNKMLNSPMGSHREGNAEHLESPQQGYTSCTVRRSIDVPMGDLKKLPHQANGRNEGKKIVNQSMDFQAISKPMDRNCLSLERGGKLEMTLPLEENEELLQKLTLGSHQDQVYGRGSNFGYISDRKYKQQQEQKQLFQSLHTSILSQPKRKTNAMSSLYFKGGNKTQLRKGTKFSNMLRIQGGTSGRTSLQDKYFKDEDLNQASPHQQTFMRKTIQNWEDEVVFDEQKQTQPSRKKNKLIGARASQADKDMHKSLLEFKQNNVQVPTAKESSQSPGKKI